MSDKYINIHTGKVIERYYDGIIAVQIGNAAYVPAVGMVTMTKAAFEHLMIHSGALPEAHLVPYRQPLNAALNGEL